LSEAQTTDVIRRFNEAFLRHDSTGLVDLVGEGCVMETIQPAPNGARYEGRAACLGFWQELAADRSSQFEVEDVAIAGDRATIRWRFRFGAGAADSVRGVNLMHVREGRIVEALGYSKTPDGDGAPLRDSLDAAEQ
jgi:ketosteroid isomerase-like protein